MTTADEVTIEQIEVVEGATVGDALAQLGNPVIQAAFTAGELTLALHGRAATVRGELSEGDRIELLGPLLIDPKSARRTRAGIAPRKRRG